jgi:hypothetical protein
MEGENLTAKSESDWELINVRGPKPNPMNGHTLVGNFLMFTIKLTNQNITDLFTYLEDTMEILTLIN